MSKDGAFYLGKDFLLDKNELLDKRYEYRTSDLTTHAVVFGMTGSGKTGLCMDLLEEAIREDIPLVIVDPKGDVANLALLFPELSPQEFKNWVSVAEAQKEGKTLEAYTQETAENWKKGLSSWGISPGDIAAIKEKMDLRIFTPGSSAGMPVSIIQGFKAPASGQDDEAMLERIRNTVSALLSLLDISGDPLTSKPHILISNLIEYFWRSGRDLSLEELIINIQKPPFRKLGVFDIDQVMSEKERVELAFKINNIIASPGFRYWKTGAPLSGDIWFEKKAGKVPVNIFYIAHLNDNERMFFVSLLMNELVDWMRKQSGATDLKYLFYMDEIFGYLPAYPQNPPSKNPMLILMKQARAFGLGVVLVTQNPKDIDYKALTNAGTWFMGKLQAEIDRERVLEGLRGMADASGASMEAEEISTLLASLKKRVFLVKNANREGLKVFQTRWAMSYLAGPITRDQIKGLLEVSGSQIGQGQPGMGFTSPIPPPTATPSAAPVGATRSDLLPFPPQTEGILQNLYESSANSQGCSYSPYLYLQSEVIFDDNELGIYVRKKYYTSVPLDTNPDWQKAEMTEKPMEYSSEADTGVLGFEVPKVKISSSILKNLQMSYKNYLFSQLVLKLFINRQLKLVSQVEESADSFRTRCREVVEKMIDKEIERMKSTYEHKIQRLEDRLESEKLRVEKLEKEHKTKRTEEFLSIGESVLGVLLGSRSIRGLSAAARRRRSTSSAADQVKMGQTKLSQFEEEMKQLQEELEDKTAQIEDNFYAQADKVEDFDVRLEKDDIIISQQSLLWKLKRVVGDHTL